MSVHKEIVCEPGDKSGPKETQSTDVSMNQTKKGAGSWKGEGRRREGGSKEARKQGKEERREAMWFS